MKKIIFKALLLSCAFSALLADNTQNLVRDFELFKLKGKEQGAPTLLLIGGIHGNEAGAYYATDFFLRHYRIIKGNVWLVPVANPHGMFANMRGVYGDMNRKFAALSADDPDYESINKIKKLLASPEIDISMHLHDGSGYWRPTYINSQQNPHRWGNCSVIDQPSLEGVKYGELEVFVAQMVADINQHITNPLYRYHVHNTHTQAKHDVEQLKALTFYSLSLGKPALTNEASKDLDVPTRVYYHLIAIESLLGQLGITFERDFSLSIPNIRSLLEPTDLYADIGGFSLIPLASLRPLIANFPFPINTQAKAVKIKSESKLLGIVKNQKNTLELKYGSRTLSTLLPEYREFDTSLKSLTLKVDNTIQEAKIGSLVYVKESIEFQPKDGYRINVIGYVKPQTTPNATIDESGITIYKKDFIPRYSLDTRSQIYRAEVYKGDQFSGMITLSFALPTESNPSNFMLVHYNPAPNSPLAQKLAQKDKKPISDTSLAQKDKLAQADLSNKNLSNTLTAPKQIPTTQTHPVKPSKEQHGVSALVKSSKGLNLRTQPNTSAPIIAKLPQYAQVLITNTQGKWQQIIYKSPYIEHKVQGFVIASALQLTQDSKNAEDMHTNSNSKNNLLISSQKVQQSSPPSSYPNQNTKNQTPPQARIKVNLAFIRTQPNTSAPIIAKAPFGREMQILNTQGDWSEIYYLFEGKEGKREIHGFVATRLLQRL